ncbi:cytochrome P450 4V2-like [Dermacentor andersoni]|uniref:cytochrome P450 4V2-like n=1 Tax=Dermacentor andersoni TaxID=34620 RepID=UPI003B3B884B
MRVLFLLGASRESRKSGDSRRLRRHSALRSSPAMLLLLLLLLLLVAVASASAVLLLAAHASRRRTWKYVKRMPGPSEVIPMRTVLQLQLTVAALKRHAVPPNAVIMQTRLGFCKQFEEKGMFCFYIGSRPCVTVFKAEHIEAVLNNHATQSKASTYWLLHSWLGTGLLTSSGDKWKSRRRMLTPAFHFKILEDFVGPMNAMARLTAAKIEEQLSKPWIDVVPLAASCTLNVLLETIMGFSNPMQDSGCRNYVQNVTSVAEKVVSRSQAPWLFFDYLYYKTEEGREYHKHISEIHDFTKRVISKRREELLREISNEATAPQRSLLTAEGDRLFGHSTRLNFIDILLRYSIQVDSSLTDEDIREEVDTFMFEGHDTTAMGIAWSLYLIALYPDVQVKIQKELDSVFKEYFDSDITLEGIKELKFLDCVLKECQRLYPSVPVVGRAVNEKMKIGEYTIPENSDIDIVIYALHRDPTVFPDPEAFKPERFLRENAANRHPYAYIPFSAGPRNCIGQRYASMELKIIVATVLRRFYLKALDHRDQLIMKCELVLRPENGLRIVFTPRQYHV